jgi:hypothetical protein
MQRLIICLLAVATISCHAFFHHARRHVFQQRPADQLHSIVKALNQFNEHTHMFNRIMTAAPSKNVVVIKERIVTTEDSAPLTHNKYDKCLDLVEVVNKNIVEMARICLDGNWRDTIPVFIDTAQKTANAVKCFIDAGKTSVATSLKIDPECVIDHLNLATESLEDALKAVLHGRWADAEKAVQAFTDILADIKNC